VNSVSTLRLNITSECVSPKLPDAHPCTHVQCYTNSIEQLVGDMYWHKSQQANVLHAFARSNPPQPHLAKQNTAKLTASGGRPPCNESRASGRRKSSAVDASARSILSDRTSASVASFSAGQRTDTFDLTHRSIKFGSPMRQRLFHGSRLHMTAAQRV
jgi:hypothetical protein